VICFFLQPAGWFSNRSIFPVRRWPDFAGHAFNNCNISAIVAKQLHCEKSNTSR